MNSSKFPHISLIRSDIDGFIFDLDGTLLDSMKLWNEVDIKFLSSYGFEVTSDYTDYVKSVSVDEASRYTKERYNLTLSPDEIKDTWYRMVAKAYKEDVRIFDGVKQYIEEAYSAGIRIAAATALSRENSEAALKNNGILKYFDSLITLEDISSGIDKSKPDIYLMAASSLGIKPDRCLVFEDVPIALTGASRGGFKTCAVFDIIGAGDIKTWDNMRKSADYFLTNWHI